MRVRRCDRDEDRIYDTEGTERGEEVTEKGSGVERERPLETRLGRALEEDGLNRR